MKIGIVILNWNGIELLKTYLPSVVAHSIGHKIYLADNASTDDSIKWIKNKYPRVHIIAMPKNTGYAGGYNIALKSVEEKVVCLLNNDVAVTAGWCDTLGSRFDLDRQLAACQPKLLDDKKKEYFEYAGAAGGFLDRYAYPFCRGRIFDTIEKDLGQYDDPKELHWGSGACLFLRKSAFVEVGEMDEDYFAHQEEIDLCWRLRHAGYTIGYEPNSLVYHLGGGTLNSLSAQKTFYNFRNSLYNIVKNEHASNWIFILYIRMLLDGVAGIRFLTAFKWSHFIAVIRAHFSFYAHFYQLLQKRKKVKLLKNTNKSDAIKLSVVYQYFIKGNKTYKSVIQ